MILRASAKFQKHYQQNAGKAVLPVGPFPQTWNLDLLPHGRSQLIVLASEEYSLFSFMIPLTRARGYPQFVTAFQARLVTWMDNISLWERPDLNEIQLSKRTDRRVIGSQNDFLSISKTILLNFERPISPEDVEKVERKINSMPMSYLDMDSPDRAFWKYKCK